MFQTICTNFIPFMFIFVSNPMHKFVSLWCLYLFQTLRTYLYPFNIYMFETLCTNLYSSNVYIILLLMELQTRDPCHEKDTTKEHLVGPRCPWKIGLIIIRSLITNVKSVQIQIKVRMEEGQLKSTSWDLGVLEITLIVI